MYYEEKAKKDSESVFRHAHFRTLDEFLLPCLVKRSRQGGFICSSGF